jgi:hypothetical protein
MDIPENRYSYKFSEFSKYQELNNYMPDELLKYCVLEQDTKIPSLNTFKNELNDIITSITKGDDPNDITLKNKIKFFANTIGLINYHDYLQQIIKLNYKKKENMHFLVSELIKSSIICKIAYTGYNLEENETKQVPDVCADILQSLSPLVVTIDNTDVVFHTEIIDVCHKYFKSYLVVNKSMNEHNTYNSDNYKGFMTFMGLLYQRNIVSNIIINDCITKIKETIFNGIDNINNLNLCSRTQIECLNFYKGYENLLNHVYHSLKYNISKIIDCNISINTNISNLDKNSDTYLKEYLCGKSYSEIINNNNIINKELLTQKNGTIKSLNDLKKYINNNDIYKELTTTIINNQKNNLNTQIEKYNGISNKLIELLNNVIVCHKDIKNLNTLYVAVNETGEHVQPLRKYTMITHNNFGSKLNKLATLVKNNWVCDIEEYL